MPGLRKVIRNPFPIGEIPAEQLSALIERTACWPEICGALKLERLRRSHAPDLAPGWVDVEIGDDLVELEAFAEALGRAARFDDDTDRFMVCQCGVVMQWVIAIHLELGTGRFVTLSDLPAPPTRQ